MKYIIDAWHEEGARVLRVLDTNFEEKELTIYDALVAKCIGIEFNNINNKSTLDSLYFNIKITSLLENSVLTVPKEVITLLSEMKSSRGVSIGYLLINNKGKLDIQSNEEIITKLSKKKIYLINGAIASQMTIGISTLEMQNIKDEILTRDEISEIYAKYKQGITIIDKRKDVCKDD